MMPFGWLAVDFLVLEALCGSMIGGHLKLHNDFGPLLHQLGNCLDCLAIMSHKDWWSQPPTLIWVELRCKNYQSSNWIFFLNGYVGPRSGGVHRQTENDVYSLSM